MWTGKQGRNPNLMHPDLLETCVHKPISRAFPKTREATDLISRSRGLLQFLAVLLAGACGLAAQSKMPEDLAAGKILVATRDAPDPLFTESVVLLVRYNETGALGLMVNRRTTVPISRALSDLQGAAGHSDPVFVGGPVELYSRWLARLASRTVRPKFSGTSTSL
jgi:hypothetical protein